MQSDDTPIPTQDEIKARLLDAALIHVAFDGWTEATFRAAAQDAGIEPAMALALCPRGAVDLAIAYHKRGDLAMVERMKITDMTGMRYRDKVAQAVRFRLEAATDKEAVRRGVTLFALPQHAADGAKLIWGTADAIWTALGDTSEDGNWYSKRATLSAVYSSTVLYWLGDDSPEHAATWAFLDRRIDDVMRIESFKAQARRNPLLMPFMIGPDWLAKQIKAPKERDQDLPGSLQPRA